MHPAIQTNIILCALIGAAVYFTGNPLCLAFLYLLQAPQPQGMDPQQLADALGQMQEGESAAAQMGFIDTNNRRHKR